MKRTAIALTLILALLLPTIAGTHFVKPVNARKITVPNDYSTIQSAIDAANDGDIVFVKIGYYPETLVINKSIWLIGEDRNLTIIDARKAHSPVILVEGNNVMVANFTLGNSGFHPITNSGWYQENGEGDGIRIYIAPSGGWYPQYINIINNTIIGCPFYGIDIGLSWYDSIVDNTIIGNADNVSPFPLAKGSGISVSCLYSVIENNTFANTGSGISFTSTYVVLGDQTYNLNESNTIQGNQNITLTSIPSPFPSIVPSPTASPTPIADGFTDNSLLLMTSAVVASVIVATAGLTFHHKKHKKSA